MNLSNEEKCLIEDHVTMFAAKMILSASKNNPEEYRSKQISDFYQLLCDMLEAAKRDSRYEALVTSCN